MRSPPARDARPWRAVGATLALLSSVACAPNVMSMAITPADMTAASRALEPGTSAITGSALVRQRGGGVVTCAGNDVFLIPSTESAGAELRRVFGGEEGYVPRGGTTTMGGGTIVLPPEPNRKATCDAQGFFGFEDVREGRWHVLTNITWTVGEQYQGGALLSTVTAAAGEETEIVLRN